MPTQRNPYAIHPLLRKGGVHTQSKTARRSQNRQNLLQEADDYMQEHLQPNEIDDELVEKMEEEHDAPLSIQAVCFLITV